MSNGTIPVRRRVASLLTDAKPKPELDAATERLNQLYELAEAKLRALAEGVSADVLVFGPDPEDPGAVYLSFRKSGDSWGLFFVWVDETGEESSVTPIASSPRNFRRVASTKLDALRAAIEENRSKELDEIKTACAAVELFLGRGEP